MTPITCLVIDDEPISQDIIRDYILLCPELLLRGTYNSALKASEIMASEKIDLLFLDINMPVLSGMGFIKSLKNTPLVVFITAYPEYALEGYEVHAVDYLLKPVSFERFRLAVGKVVERLESRASLIGDTTQFIMLKADRRNYRIDLNEIEYIEAQGDYVRLSMHDKSLVVHGTLKDLLNILPDHQFVRIHKSYVVALNKIEYIEGNIVKVGKHKLPVSNSCRESLLRLLNQK